MPTQKDFKRLVRRRMQKTGESYTAARAQLLKTRVHCDIKGPPPPSLATARHAATPRRPKDYAKLAGMSDATIKAKTGCTWKGWVDALDYARRTPGRTGRSPSYVHEKFEIPGWWAQAVTVGYERIRGLREIGQRRGGSYEASKSRTFAVPVATLFDAFAVPRRAGQVAGRRQALGAQGDARQVGAHHLGGGDVGRDVAHRQGSRQEASASVQHRKLPDKEATVRMKAYWTERLGALGDLLEG